VFGLLDLKVAKASMFDELFRDHACGGLQCGGVCLVLGAENAASPDCFPHLGRHSRLGSQRVTGDSCESFKWDRGMLGIKSRIGEAGCLPLNL
jgi:hypothetical protein